MKNKYRIKDPIIKAKYVNHTNKPVSNRGGDLEIEVSNIVTEATINEIQERANQIAEKQRFLSKKEAAKILDASVRTIDRQITNGWYNIHTDNFGTVRIYKNSFYEYFNIK